MGALNTLKLLLSGGCNAFSVQGGGGGGYKAGWEIDRGAAI